MFRNLPTLPTFKSLPQAIGLPFLSTQEDAQLRFKSGENGIKRLYGDSVSPHMLASSSHALESLAHPQRRSSQAKRSNLGDSHLGCRVLVSILHALQQRCRRVFPHLGARQSVPTHELAKRRAHGGSRDDHEQ